MTLVDAGVSIYFGLPQTGGDFFTLDDPVKGLLDGSYELADEPAADVSDDAWQVHVRRGRNRALDEFEAGECDVSLRNHDRTFDNSNALSPYYGKVVPGRRVVVTLWGQTVFAGVADDWDNDWPVDGDANAHLFAIDGMGELGLREFNEWTTTGSQTAGPRLTDALNRTEVNYSIDRDIDTGVSILQGDNVTWGSNVLNYLQLVAKSDAGRLFVTRSGTLRFQDRRALLNATSTVDFRDDGTGIPFHGVATINGSELLYTRVGVDREGGTLQTVEDAAAVEEYGDRPFGVSGLLMDTDEQSADMADYLLNSYKAPVDRIAVITVKVNALDPSDRGAVTRLDIGDVISVSWTPQGIGDPIEQTLVVEGVEHVADFSGMHAMTIYTSLAEPLGVFTLDDPVFGLLDAANRLAF